MRRRCRESVSDLSVVVRDASYQIRDSDKRVGRCPGRLADRKSCCGLFRGRRGQQLYCIFVARVMSRDYKRFLSHGFCCCARSLHVTPLQLNVLPGSTGAKKARSVSVREALSGGTRWMGRECMPVLPVRYCSTAPVGKTFKFAVAASAGVELMAPVRVTWSDAAAAQSRLAAHGARPMG